MTVSDAHNRKAGFTLIEALVSLTLVLAFAGALGPLLFQSRRIFIDAHGQTRADILLRALLQSSDESSRPEIGVREGDSGAFHWRVEIEPYIDDINDSGLPFPSKSSPPKWTLFHITAHVSWGAGQEIAADTLRLAHVQ